MKPDKIPKKGYYYHYKRKADEPVNHHAYEFRGIGVHTEDDCKPGEEFFVDYRPLFETGRTYLLSRELGVPVTEHRPLRMFLEMVTINSKTIPRFEKINDPEIIKQLDAIKKDLYQEK